MKLASQLFWMCFGAIAAVSLVLERSTCVGRACMYIYGLPKWFPVWW